MLNSTFELWKRDRLFRSKLEDMLSGNGIRYSNCEFGRSNTNAYWFVTVIHPFKGLLSLSAEFSSDTDMYSDNTLTNLVSRIVNGVA
jgi:hypothetical protein